MYKIGFDGFKAYHQMNCTIAYRKRINEDIRTPQINATKPFEVKLKTEKFKSVSEQLLDKTLGESERNTKVLQLIEASEALRKAREDAKTATKAVRQNLKPEMLKRYAATLTIPIFATRIADANKKLGWKVSDETLPSPDE